MKTTLVFPDDLMTEIKIESARRHQTLKSLIPELIRVGLAWQRQNNELSPEETIQKRRAAATEWIENWQNIGSAMNQQNSKEISSVALLEADRGARG